MEKLKSGIELMDSYAFDVMDGEIPVCKYVKLAVKRHFRDLERAETDEFPYYFEPKAAQHVLDYFGFLKHWKGSLAGEYIQLEPWQVFYISSLFGWLDKETKFRRFRESYKECPRKNGKTTLLAGIGLYLMDWDGEPGAEIYSAATSRNQSKIVFKDAKQMIKANPKLAAHFTMHNEAIYNPAENSSFQPLSKEHKRLDGLNTHGGIFDELHAWDKRELYDVIDTSTGARDQPMLCSITTAGTNKDGICYEIRDYAIKILEGTIDDERFFAIIYTVDEKDLENWDDPKVWRKANPNFGVSLTQEDLYRIASKARQSEAKKADFLTKRLNVWVSSYSKWLDVGLVRKNSYKEDLTIEDFKGEPCYMALDLASKLDLCSLYVLFQRDGDYFAFGRNYVPENAVNKELIGAKSIYKQLRYEDNFILTPGVQTDYSFIYEDALTFCRDFDVRSLGFDPFKATQLITQLQNNGLEAIEIRNTAIHLSEPSKQLEAWIHAKLFSYNDKVLEWALGNVVVRYDKKDNIYPTKERRDEKIDPAMALIMAIALELQNPLAGAKKKKRKPRVFTI